MKKSRLGFTLIEIIVTISIFLVISAVVVVNLAGRRSAVDLTYTSKEIVTTLREAQNNAMTQKSSSIWGVHFYNATSSFYSLFYGSYGTGSVAGQYPLPNDVQFSTASVPYASSVDVTFAQVTGIPSTSTSIILNLIVGQNATSISSTTITISSVGLIANQ